MSYRNFHHRQLPFALRYMADLIKYRHLCWNLVGSDLRARFRRSRLGILWAIIQPLAFSMMVAAVWGSVFKEHSYLTFAVYVFSGLLVWDYVQSTALVSLDSLLSAQGYLKQARIPFVIFQMRIPLSGMVILLFGLIGLLIMMAVTGQLPPIGLHLLLIPAEFGLLLLFAIPCSILFSILGASFRDARYIVQLAFQGLFFLTPVMLGRKILEQPGLHFIQYINPGVPIIDMFRDPLLYGQLWDRTDVIVLSIWIGALWALALIASAQSGRRLVFAV